MLIKSASRRRRIPTGGPDTDYLSQEKLDIWSGINNSNNDADWMIGRVFITLTMMTILVMRTSVNARLPIHFRA